MHQNDVLLDPAENLEVGKVFFEVACQLGMSGNGLKISSLTNGEFRVDLNFVEPSPRTEPGYFPFLQFGYRENFCLSASGKTPRDAAEKIRRTVAPNPYQKHMI